MSAPLILAFSQREKEQKPPSPIGCTQKEGHSKGWGEGKTLKILWNMIFMHRHLIIFSSAYPCTNRRYPDNMVVDTQLLILNSQ